MLIYLQSIISHGATMNKEDRYKIIAEIIETTGDTSEEFEDSLIKSNSKTLESKLISVTSHHSELNKSYNKGFTSRRC